MTHFEHDQVPHVYVICWPDLGVVKVGITTRAERWQWWTRRGAVLVWMGDTCCEAHARTMEAWLLRRLGEVGARAFKTAATAHLVLGRKASGYTECYRLVQSPRFGEDPEHEYDHERAYGLILPVPMLDAMRAWDFAKYPLDPSWEDAPDAPESRLTVGRCTHQPAHSTADDTEATA